ncbi:MAG: hypothetical protein NTU57_02590 [Candidatus Aenigmarchaeota archaeon]|nr:hypothetical protein [Candidatus Aenigmarchaeota archaeon]
MRVIVICSEKELNQMEIIQSEFNGVMHNFVKRGFSGRITIEKAEHQDVRDAVEAELENAKKKFPYWPVCAVQAAAVPCEEAGELLQASLEFTFENGNKEAMRKEALHTAAMAIRFLERFETIKKIPPKSMEDS